MNPLLPESFLSNLPEMPGLALEAIFNHVLQQLNARRVVTEQELVEVYYVASAFAAEYQIAISLLDEDMLGSAHARDFVVQWFDNVLLEVQAIAAKERSSNAKARANEISMRLIEARRAAVVIYEFSDSSFSRLQELLNELRDEVLEHPKLEENHRRRLLKRLERLQQELHKKTSDIDRVWGLVGEAGVVLGKLGKDSKPIVDRIRELAEIVWKTVSAVEKLQSGNPFSLMGPKE